MTTTAPDLDTSSLDNLFTIECGKCGQAAPVLKWTTRPISGELPRGHYQCPTPTCSYAFTRQHNPDRWGRPMVLVPIPPVL